jgi:hypothetical protein
MQTRINEILNETGTKTAKIQKLILLGLSRTQIATLVTNGNYGFVQNVYAKMKAQGLITSAIQTSFNRRFGVEFEAYNVERQTLAEKLNHAGINCKVEGYGHDNRPHWKIVPDSSLDGYNTFELVSPILTGENGISELKTVCRVLNECGAKVNKSCGTHVHFDAETLTLQTWKNIFINYARLENTIDRFMPKSRRSDKNNFCKGFRNFPNFEQNIQNAMNINSIANRVIGGRYFKINPQSYARHKTIEFRQHNGTVDFEKISNWIYLLNNLLNRSAKGVIENTTLDGLADFNSQNIVNYFKTRTLKLNA